MSHMGPFVQLTLNDSALTGAFGKIDTTLDRHEEEIRELRKLLMDKPSRSEIIAMNENLTKLIEDKTKALNDRITALESKYDQKLKELEDNFEYRLNDTANMLNMQLRQKLDDIENRIPSSDSQISDFVDRLQTLEETVYNNGKKLHLTRDAVQQVASSIALLNNTNAVLDHTLPETLRNSIGFVTNNFKSIFDQLSQLKDQVGTIQIQGKRAVAKPEIIERTVNNSVTKEGTDIDISSIHPYPSVVAHWRDPPDLPPITQFMNIGEVVDYIYRMVPKLQAHLTAMQGKIVENAQDILNKVDKGLVEKMFEKFQSVIGEMAGRVDELKDCLEQTATRDEINDMVEDILASMNQGGETAVGRVRCIACGREIPQVAGAVTEEEATRSLGVPPNSFAYGAKSQAPIGVRYTGKKEFDSGIVESPRSVRPFKPAPSKKTIRSPR